MKNPAHEVFWKIFTSDAKFHSKYYSYGREFPLCRYWGALSHADNESGSFAEQDEMLLVLAEVIGDNND